VYEYIKIKMFSPAVEAISVSAVQVCSEKSINMYKAPEKHTEY
jgi:hypothetical protein